MGNNESDENPQQRQVKKYFQSFTNSLINNACLNNNVFSWLDLSRAEKALVRKS